MFDGAITPQSRAAHPGAGTLRVHPAPELLLAPDTRVPGENRFDDPMGLVAVRYTATRLIGCLSETMARFRPSPPAEEMLAAVEGIADGDVDWSADDQEAIATWLVAQRVGTVRVLETGFYVSIEDPEVLTQLDKHPRVREALWNFDPAARLDVALIRLGGLQRGRPISQAVGTAVREWIPNALGLATSLDCQLRSLAGRPGARPR